MVKHEATDLRAVNFLHYTVRHSFVATVAAIVLTAFVVVLVVAIAVSLVLECAARHSRFTEVVRIDTFTLQNNGALRQPVLLLPLLHVAKANRSTKGLN